MVHEPGIRLNPLVHLMQLPACDLYQKAEGLWGKGFFLPNTKPNAVLQIGPGRAVEIIFSMEQIDSEQLYGQAAVAAGLVYHCNDEPYKG